MTTRERAVVGTLVALLSAAAVMVGIAIGDHRFGGRALIALGWVGVIQGVLIGLGVLKPGHKRNRRR